MSKTWTIKLCAPLASAAILAACTQEVKDNATTNRTPVDHATDQQRQNRPVSLTGCLGAGTGTNQYVLTHVRPVPLAQQPSDTPAAANFTLPENSAVRLSMNDEDQLTKLVGQTVSVTGLLTSDGRNTIGTSGPARSPQQPESPTDKSQAATDQHHSEKVREEAGPIGNRSMNNGTYPEMTVQQVSGTGQKCVTTPVEGKR
jgi:hypothetical protein